MAPSKKRKLRDVMKLPVVRGRITVEAQEDYESISGEDSPNLTHNFPHSAVSKRQKKKGTPLFDQEVFLGATKVLRVLDEDVSSRENASDEDTEQTESDPSESDTIDAVSDAEADTGPDRASVSPDEDEDESENGNDQDIEAILQAEVFSAFETEESELSDGSGDDED